jgi:hypothetical protein
LGVIVRGNGGPILDIIPACRTQRFCGQLSSTSNTTSKREEGEGRERRIRYIKEDKTRRIPLTLTPFLGALT